MYQPNDKCEHGVYKGQQPTAVFCGLCNPDANSDRPLRLAMARRKPANRIYGEPRTLDTAAFIEQNPGVRMQAGREFLTLGDTL